MGDTRLYHDDHSPELPVCICGQPYGTGNDKPVPVPFPVPQNHLFCRHLPAAPGIYGSKRLLCGADCRRNRRPFIICCFYSGVFQISAGNRQARADRNRERKVCCIIINIEIKKLTETLQLCQFFITHIYHSIESAVHILHP